MSTESMWNPVIPLLQWNQENPMMNYSSRVIRDVEIVEEVVVPPTTLLEWQEHFKCHDNLHK